MIRHPFTGMLLACLLAGCHAPQPDSKKTLNNYGAASAVAVTRHAQYQHWDKGVWRGEKPDDAAIARIATNNDRVSFDWDGDGVELLEALARSRGLQFSYGGVRLPLPVSLHVRNMTFSNALRLIEAQTAWRAMLIQHPGVLHLTFMQTEPARK